MAMVKFAFRMLFELERIKSTDGLKFEMRIGIHTGECNCHCVHVVVQLSWSRSR
jgi:class 3 adenylate cyclase